MQRIYRGRDPRQRDDRLVASGMSSSPRLRTSRHREDMRNLVDLASRRAGGIEVVLIWNRTAETLVVFAHDDRTDEEVAITVSGDEASEVYRHPFAYAYRSMSKSLRTNRQSRRP